jgi:hypothetical protein
MGTEEPTCGCCLTIYSCLHSGIVEIRSVRVGTVVIKAVYSGFYVAMNRRGRLYGSVSDWRWAATGWQWSVVQTASLTHPPCSGSTLWTVGSGSASRRTATTHTPRDVGGTAADPCSWHLTAKAFPGKADGHDGTNCPHTSCQSWSRLEGPANGSGGMGGTQGLEDPELNNQGPGQRPWANTSLYVTSRAPAGCRAWRHGRVPASEASAQGDTQNWQFASI